MKRLVCLIAIAFTQNFTLMLVGEGVYFYTHHELAFSATENLWLALGRGGIYVAAALGSHGISARLGERRLMFVSLVGQAISYGVIWRFADQAGMLIGGILAYSVFSGAKWPVLESYFSAGRTPRESSRMVGWFNLAWGSASGLGIGLAGPIIASATPGMLFGVSVVIDAVNAVMLIALEPRLVHLAANHPERLPADRLRWYGALLDSSRGSLLLSYSLFYSFSPLLPNLFEKFAVPVAWATVLAALLHVTRFITFVAMQRFERWHGRAWTQVVAIVGLPTAYVLTVGGYSLGALLAGQVLFGLSAGLAYYAALYYAMVVKDSSVDASGKHEPVIGSGAVVGPTVGLAAKGLGIGMVAGMGVVILGATGWSVRALLRKNFGQD